MARINIACRECGKVHDVPRTNEIPSWVLSMWCNWCPACEDSADDYYEEGYVPEEDDGKGNEPQPIPVGDNQLTMPFIFDELKIPQLQKQPQ